jgi:hypothetical protein
MIYQQRCENKTRRRYAGAKREKMRVINSHAALYGTTAPNIAVLCTVERSTIHYIAWLKHTVPYRAPYSIVP